MSPTTNNPVWLLEAVPAGSVAAAAQRQSHPGAEEGKSELTCLATGTWTALLWISMMPVSSQTHRICSGRGARITSWHCAPNGQRGAAGKDWWWLWKAAAFEQFWVFLLIGHLRSSLPSQQIYQFCVYKWPSRKRHFEAFSMHAQTSSTGKYSSWWRLPVNMKKTFLLIDHQLPAQTGEVCFRWWRDEQVYTHCDKMCLTPIQESLRVVFRRDVGSMCAPHALHQWSPTVFALQQEKSWGSGAAPPVWRSVDAPGCNPA